VAVNRNSLLANLLTVGNGICGFASVVLLMKVELGESGGFANPKNISAAAFLVLLGMLFDVFDGRIARMSKGTTELGAQLDSFCDLVTFGLAPAVMIVRLNMGLTPSWQSGWQNVVWFFSLAYFLGALLRLARFNVEHSPDENAHLAFKGLPTPAAAGCIASLVIFQRYVEKFEADELKFLAHLFGEEAIKECVWYITPALPFLGLVLGFTMVSVRLKYEHVGSMLFARVQSFDFFVYLVFGAVLLAVVPELVLPVAFLGYLLWTPLNALLRRILHQRKEEPVSHEGN
jgi:CDP-diacylglycerol--serine O-phosphatidyltransferase